MLITDFAAMCGALSPALPVYMTSEDDDGERRLPVTRIGHHNPPEVIHSDMFVDLFTPQWGAEQRANMTPLTLKAILADLAANFSGPEHIRVGVPTDQGHHRMLDIMKISVAAIDGKAVAEIQTEAWNKLEKTIRID